MSKALRTTLVLVILISAAANAPGLLLALGNSEADPADAKAGSSVAPVDYYAYDYDYDTTQSDPGAWLDALFQASNDTPVASWRHTWTDFEAAPTADALNPYRRPAHWEPEGVLFAYVSTFGDIGYSDVSENVSSPGSNSVRGLRLTGFGAGAAVPGKSQEGKGVEGPDDQPDPGPAPDDDPPPPDDVTPVPPGVDEPDTDPVPGDQPVSVPEPASMGLFVLGLAGLFWFGKRRRVAVPARDGRDRA